MVKKIFIILLFASFPVYAEHSFFIEGKVIDCIDNPNGVALVIDTNTERGFDNYTILCNKNNEEYCLFNSLHDRVAVMGAMVKQNKSKNFKQEVRFASRFIEVIVDVKLFTWCRTNRVEEKN